MTFKVGDIVRYAGGSTALARLVFPHAHGWHADHCLGGGLFVSESYPGRMTLATQEDIDVVMACDQCVWTPEQTQKRLKDCNNAIKVLLEAYSCKLCTNVVNEPVLVDKNSSEYLECWK